ncbi:MAG: Mur ligase family protein [Chitinophagales bacterium]
MNIHFIAIGGAIMHSLAIALKHKGYQITGSDDKIADPALTNLKREGILPEAIGFYPEKIGRHLDAVILGMHARIDNPELLKAQELGIPVFSFPQYVYEVSKNKKRIVIAGSHGKTTITSMVMHVLQATGMEIDYIVGAKVKGFESGVRLSESAKIIVIEGDEYLASPVERESKFMFYHPHIALISGVAWDHINVFPVYEGYVNQFARFAATVADDGVITYYGHDPELQKIASEYSGKAHLIPYDTAPYEIQDGITYLQTSEGHVPLHVFGKHNMQNIAGAREVCLAAGVSMEAFNRHIASFEGAANRLQLLDKNRQTAVYKDFAHAPSKLKATVQAMTEQYPERRLVAVMELHTFSSLNRDFLTEYHGSMNACDRAILFLDKEAMALKQMATPERELLLDAFGNSKIEIYYEMEALEAALRNEVWPGSNLLLMTSGTFGGMNLNALAAGICKHSA